MRKTRLVILPAKCLNKVGFLLLFLSCPVIGDWGRIRPDTEMSQWSVLIEKEGSCGLVRDSGGIKPAGDGLSEFPARLSNGTQADETPAAMLREAETDTRSEKAGVAVSDSGRKGERQSNMRRETARSATPGRSVERRQVRRSVSLEREKAFRYDENSRRMVRAVSRERRLDKSGMDRRANDVLQRRSRSLSVTRREREIRERSNVERETRRRERDSIERDAERRASRERSHVRGERRASLARRERNDATERRDDRSARVTTARREGVAREERRNARRVERGDAVVQSRRNEERMDARRGEARLASREGRNQPDARRERDNGRRSSERRGSIRREDSARREEPLVRGQRSLDSFTNREALVKARRIDLARKVQRDGTQSRRTESEALSRAPARLDKSREDRIDGRLATYKTRKGNEVRKWDIVDSVKAWWLSQKANEPRVTETTAYGDFATTCLVGAAVYFLTTTPLKSI